MSKHTQRKKKKKSTALLDCTILVNKYMEKEVLKEVTSDFSEVASREATH